MSSSCIFFPISFTRIRGYVIIMMPIQFHFYSWWCWLVCHGGLLCICFTAFSGPVSTLPFTVLQSFSSVIMAFGELFFIMSLCHETILYYRRINDFPILHFV
uniref:Uncharacterized protein n=1 Tax=Populus davidiana TaxID=266767 RepID=A0A6M2F485_9ROSI